MSRSDQIELEFRAEAGGTSQNARLRDYLQARPGRWIPMPELADAIGAYAVHSRVADCRSKFSMRIEQRNERHDHKTHSFYQYIPDQDAPQTL